MKPLNTLGCMAGMLLMSTAWNVYAYPGESIALDANGDYIITYRSSDDSITTLLQTKFSPATKIVPSIQSQFSINGESRVNAMPTIRYRYTLANGAVSKQSIIDVWLDDIPNSIIGERERLTGAAVTKVAVRAVRTANEAALPAPSGWRGDIIRSMSRIVWGPDDYARDSIAPGSKLSGFSLNSVDIPGISMAKFRGSDSGWAPFGYPDEGPAEDSAVKEELEQLRDNDFVTRPAAVPTIAVPTSFNAATLLERIQTHVHTWIGMKLLDPEFSAQLDTSFKGAIDGYRYNQPKMGKSHIKTMRALLKKAYPDLDNEDIVDEETGNNKGTQFKNGMIARLAARVLDFDLKYVLKQVGDE